MDRQAWWAIVSPWGRKESDTTEGLTLWNVEKEDQRIQNVISPHYIKGAYNQPN